MHGKNVENGLLKSKSRQLSLFSDKNVRGGTGAKCGKRELIQQFRLVFLFFPNFAIPGKQESYNPISGNPGNFLDLKKKIRKHFFNKT